MNIIIENVTVITMDSQRTLLHNGYVHVQDTVIAGLGTGSYKGQADVVIDGRGGILMPGMVNTHCHASMIPFRSMGDDCPDRLRRFLFPLELKAMTPRLCYLAAKYAICEMLLSGVTTFLDMYYFEDQVAKACEELGIRSFLGETIINMETCDSPLPYGGLLISEQFLRDWKDHELVTPIVAPHGTNTNELDVLIKAHELAKQHHTLFTIHTSEMDYEMTYFKENYGKTPVEFLYDAGLLDENTILAHCIHMTDHDLELAAKSEARIAHCIGSNTKAGKGVARVKEMLDSHIPVGFGTDGPSSGNTLSMMTQFRLFSSFQKTYYHDRSLFPAADIIELGTIGGARVLHAESQIGSIEPGKKADLVLVETESVNMFPCFNPYSAIVYSANASNVDTVLVNGKIVVREKKMNGVDLVSLREELKQEMREFMRAAEEYPDII